LTPKLDGNFCLFVAKRGRACSRLNIYLRNMVTGKELATVNDDQAMPLAGDSNFGRIAQHQGSVLVRLVAKLSGAMKSRVPLGYEDDGGFHYGADLAG